MREIKFQAWDKKKGEIVPVEEVNNWRIGGSIQSQLFEKMQYTGLKDKHGVEIYEGYIVEQEFTELGATEGVFNNPPDDMTSFIGEIKMYDGSWWIDSGSWAIPLFSELSPNEIIGNRFENPELLEAIR